MAEIERKIIVSNSEMRPCTVHGKKALFHRWVDKCEIVSPSVMRGGHSGGELRETLALFEYEDGTVGEALPQNIRFLDDKEIKKEKAEFACRVCFEKMKRENPNARGCAWRCLNNEYCDELKKIIEQEDAKQ